MNVFHQTANSWHTCQNLLLLCVYVCVWRGFLASDSETPVVICLLISYLATPARFSAIWYFNFIVYIHFACHFSVSTFIFDHKTFFCLKTDSVSLWLQFGYLFFPCLHLIRIAYMQTHTDTLSHIHTPADIRFDSWVSHDTQGRNRRIQQVQYSMSERIQDFSIPRGCWKTLCIFIRSGCVWSHKQKQKGIGHML